MARWFRFYDEALDDPKVQRLAPHLFKTWVNLLCLASKDGGKLPSNDDIAFRLRISVQDAAQQVEDLILAGLIDIDASRERAPHNWEDRQYASDSSAERMRKHRENKRKKPCDVTSDVTVTVQKQSRTDSETEQSRAERASARSEGLKDFSGLAGHGREVSARLMRRAEGLGLAVATLRARALEPDVKKPNGMFKRVCVDELAKTLPQARRETLEAVFDSDAAFGTVCQMLLEAA